MSLSAESAKSLAEARLAEANALLRSSLFSGAYYLAGYAIELALKAIIAKQFLANEIPDKQFVLGIYSHKLSDLIKLAGLSQALTGSDADFQTNWLTATQWSEASRYAIIEDYQAAELITAITDPDTGVFQWLKSHW